MRIPIADPLIGEEELKNVEAAVRSGWISSKGEFIAQFERGFARYCGVSHGVATSNGTTALHLALAALGIGEGDEVIVPTLTFIATANSVTYTKARPVLVDSHPDHWCIDPHQIEQRITSRTRAIIPVHLYGHPCDMEAIRVIANKYHLYVIEDAAEAHGAEYLGRRVGGFGDVGCFSFFGNKIVTTGEGGICLTNDDDLARKMRILRDHGMNPEKEYWHDVIGFNYRMTNMQAAIGVAQMEKIDMMIERRRQLSLWYAEALGDLTRKGLIRMQPEMSWARKVCWMFSILVDDRCGMSRDGLREKLRDKGIETRPLFHPLHMMPPYSDSRRFPVAEELSRRGLSLPSGYSLGQAQVSTIAGCISDAFSDNC